MHEPRGTAWWKAALKTALHWWACCCAIELVYCFIAAGRLTNADTGLLNGTILALGTFTSGVHTNWRLVVIGAALGLGTAAVAYIEQYLWVLFALALLALGSHHRASPACAAAAKRRPGRTRVARPAEASEAIDRAD